jgi:hypothetical protein
MQIGKLPFKTPSFGFKHLEHSYLVRAQGIALNRLQMLHFKAALNLVNADCGFWLFRRNNVHAHVFFGGKGFGISNHAINQAKAPMISDRYTEYNEAISVENILQEPQLCYRIKAPIKT